MTSQPIVIWQFHDEKPGHLNQLRGLTTALSELLPVDIHAIKAPSRSSSLAAMLTNRMALVSKLPTPDLLIGAGHATHFAMLAARRAYGGKAVVLMKPSLPTTMFDLCFIPEHDQPSPSADTVTTRGVLNVIRPTVESQQPNAGLLLIGGPSTTHQWSDKQMLDQIGTIVTSNPSIHWQLTTSRRTPATFLPLLERQKLTNLQAVPHMATTPSWVPEQLARASQVWVSEDSVSMVYEALTSGASVGVLEVSNKKQGRVAAGMEKLIADGWATRFATWQPGDRLSPPPEQLDEARRCAEIVIRRLLSNIAA